MLRALPAPPAAEGAFASRPPTVRSPLPQVPASLVAAVGGLAVGRFGWADLVAQTAANARTDAAQRIGLVLPQFGTWQRIFFDEATGTWRVRQGLPVTLATRGDFWARFAGGASPGQPVYANMLDGSAVAGNTAGCELTLWSVITPAGAGELAIISTGATFS